MNDLFGESSKMNAELVLCCSREITDIYLSPKIRCFKGYIQDSISGDSDPAQIWGQIDQAFQSQNGRVMLCGGRAAVTATIAELKQRNSYIEDKVIFEIWG